jgi:hypothetical protein
MKFYQFLEKDFARKILIFPSFTIQPIGSKNAFWKNTALYFARGAARVPSQIIFKNEREVSAFQKSVSIAKKNIGGFELELQTAAMYDLLKSIAEAEVNDLTITPRGADSARRNYAQTVELWASRVVPALAHWTKKGKLTVNEAEDIRSRAV